MSAEARDLPWHVVTGAQAIEHLSSGPQGLSGAEAAGRLALHGPNDLAAAAPIRPLDILAEQFRSLIVWLLVAAALVSMGLGEWVDGMAILLIVLLNALIGFYQEYGAQRSIAALRRMTAPHAKVWREGRLVSRPAAELVPGDVVALEAGDVVPADVRILAATELRCIEAALTGESEPVAKQVEPVAARDLPLGDRSSMAYMGTGVAAGTGKALVVATGMRTEIGHIAGLLQSAGSDQTPLQRRLQAFGRSLVWAALAVVALVFGLGVLRAMPLTELFMTSVSLAVAAVPEGLLAVVTVALAVGVQRMARRGALIRRLVSVETLGTSTVICTDKTGTLTVGEMTVRQLLVAEKPFSVTGEGYAPEGAVLDAGKEPRGQDLEHVRLLLTLMLGCSDATLTREGDRWVLLGDPTEGALLAAAAKVGIGSEALEVAQPRVGARPFDSDRKRMTVLRRTPAGKTVAMVKGAPESLLERCASYVTPEGVRPLGPAERLQLNAAHAELARQGLRVLGAACRELEPPEAEQPAETIERRLVWVGAVGLYDPPRPEAREAIARCHTAGIRVVMITGDHPATAQAIARDLGLSADGQLMTGAELERASEAELAARVPEVSVFARVSAEHKLRIVRAWQANHGVVAMTGDGVNDAPAIKGADIGVAMGRSGTEVTKDAADMVITDDNFASIVAAVEEGRGVYANIRKTLQYLLAGNAGELMFVTACILIGLPMPLQPIHLLWINLVTDGLPALALATDPIEPGVMREAPRPPTESLADAPFIRQMVLTGLLTGGVAFGVYLHALDAFGLDTARTAAFAALVYAELFRALGARSDRKPIWQLGLLTNAKLALLVAASLLFQPWQHHSPILGALFQTVQMGWDYCLALMAVSLLPATILEGRKLWRQRMPVGTQVL